MVLDEGGEVEEKCWKLDKLKLHSDKEKRMRNGRGEK